MNYPLFPEFSYDEPTIEALDEAIETTSEALIERQQQDGHWVFALEADATIPAEYIMLMHYLDEIDADLQAKIVPYLRKIQGQDGGWPLFHDGAFDLSATVKAYLALKLAGDDVNAPHMRRARGVILSAGGAARANVFTRTALALFGFIPWRGVPVMPVEIMILPKWFPFHISKIAYWSRTVIAPLVILMSLKPRAINPAGVTIEELFLVPADQEKRYMHAVVPNFWGTTFRLIDVVLRKAEPYFPQGLRALSIRKAMEFSLERINGLDGLGGIFPAMANSVMAMVAVGYPKDDPTLVTAKESLRRLVIQDDEGDSYVQPCVSPVWDTCLAEQAMLEVADSLTRDPAKQSRVRQAIAAASDWLVPRQILDVVGDWAFRRPNIRPGGWAFQYANDYYPDVDDTAVVVMALDRAGDPKHRESIDRALEWVIGMQSDNGGWGAFDADNTHYYLNYIPFADHGALLDPPTVDVSARCISMLAQTGMKRGHPVIDRGVAYLWAEQEADGSWFGRWGTNYIYGTWSALCALNAAGEDLNSPGIQRAVDWLISKQLPDGGWGEDGLSYYPGREGIAKVSTASQTAWALLGLMAAGKVNHPVVAHGIAYLLEHRNDDTAMWREDAYSAVGFPRVFYLRYHGYRKYFPLWALARYRNLIAGNSELVLHGM